MALKIATVTLVVDAYERGIAFYRDVLGLKLADDIDMGGGKRWVVIEGAGGARLLIAQADGDSQRAAIGKQAGGRVGFFLETDDFERDHARLVVAGVRFLETPRHEPYGSVAVFEDPFGNKWDLIGPKAAQGSK